MTADSEKIVDFFWGITIDKGIQIMTMPKNYIIRIEDKTKEMHETLFNKT